MWDDISTPYHTFMSGVIWKDVKTLHLGMSDIHEAFMFSLFGPSTKWKSGWLNDGVCNLSEWKLLKRGTNCCLEYQSFNSFRLWQVTDMSFLDLNIGY